MRSEERRSSFTPLRREGDLVTTESIDHLPSIAAADPRSLPFLVGDYIAARGLVTPGRFERSVGSTSTYSDETAFWKDAARGRLFETGRVLLRGFTLVEWLPRSPGRYSTPEAKRARDMAGHFVADRHGGRVVYEPHGKTQMVLGGVGVIRLTMKDVDGERVQFLGATSSGVAHRGVVVAVTSADYAQLATELAQRGGVSCDISGEIRFWRSNGNLPLASAQNMPRVYVVADAVTPARRRDRPLDITPAIVFQSGGDHSHAFYAYAHSDARDPMDIKRAAHWLADSYVGDRYPGRVMTDFDERVAHFDGVACPLSTLMDLDTPLEAATRPLASLDSRTVAIYVGSLEVGRLEGHVTTNVNITGDGNVVGNNNTVVTTINHGLDRDGLRDLGETLALLRGEILESGSAPERVRKRAARAVEDAEEELAEQSPDETTVRESLERATQTLTAAGETFDAATGWGLRLVEVGTALTAVLPRAAQWFPALLSAL